jgi:hypothetical protein
LKSGLDQQALEVLEKAKASGQVSVDLAMALGNLLAEFARPCNRLHINNGKY